MLVGSIGSTKAALMSSGIASANPQQHEVSDLDELLNEVCIMGECEHCGELDCDLDHEDSDVELDDSWFFELRLNLSLDNENNNFGIEIENFGKKDFNPGSWYVWDTLTPHRPYVDRKAPGITRTNFVLAVNPWFDYIADERCWVKNEFFGEKHPIDMVINGDVIEGLNIESLQ
jgi:hypothetical protein